MITIFRLYVWIYCEKRTAPFRGTGLLTGFHRPHMEFVYTYSVSPKLISMPGDFRLASKCMPP